MERRRTKQSDNKVNYNTRPARLPATEIEASVCSELKRYLSDPIRISDDLELTSLPQGAQNSIHSKAARLGKTLEKIALTPDDAINIRQRVQSLVLQPDMTGYELKIDLEALTNLLDLGTVPSKSIAFILVQIELTICNNGKKVIIGNKPPLKPQPNPSLINAIKTAHHIKTQYTGSNRLSLSNIASQLNMDPRQLWRTLKLAYLAPDIQLAILSGMQPKGLLLKDLIYQSLPTAWDRQRTLLGFK